MFEGIVKRGWDKISKDDLCTTKNEKDLTMFIKCTVQDYNKHMIIKYSCIHNI